MREERRPRRPWENDPNWKRKKGATMSRPGRKEVVYIWDKRKPVRKGRGAVCISEEKGKKQEWELRHINNGGCGGR